ncbi:hypothetical protein [Rubinisphaera sp. JC750]|uniref:type IV pilus modification PilV family protein n=1 Tax=Rubinisphaera sp. JC750 TaxID=2898658 RepID=UPI001F1DEB5F|nr:hypothetical protein [Rubinisphaera sp. JC750]
MQYVKPTTPEPSPAAPHAGATLVEILMSLMVMSIGLVSVASLFPISMMRSIQATQLTNAALLEFSCEDYIRAFPQLSYAHYNGSRTVANFEMSPDGTTLRRFDIGSPAQFVRALPMKFVAVVDPLGASYAATGANRFGQDPFNLHSTQDFNFQAARLNAGFDFSSNLQRQQAFTMFSSNDSWTESFVSNEVTDMGSGVLRLADVSSGDLEAFRDAIAAGTNLTGRAIVYDRTGKQSHVSLVTGVTLGTREVALAKPVPNNGMYAAIPEVRLELLEPRYTCLITIRRQLMNLGPGGLPGEDGVDDDNRDGDNNPATGADDFYEIGWPGTDDEVRNLGADLVVFFRRDFSPFGEQVYEAGNLVKGSNAPNGTQPITIRWDGGNPESRPRLQNGGWVFDPTNGFWYQITSVLIENQPANDQFNGAITNMREAVILLDRPPEASGRYLMVPERVVEVFDFPAL